MRWTLAQGWPRALVGIRAVRMMTLAMGSAMALLALGSGAVATAAARGSALRPTLGKTVVIARKSGMVTVEPRGSRTFVPLVGRRTIPVGSVVDATKGNVSLEAAAHVKRATQTASLTGSAFSVTQQKRSSLVTLTLVSRRPIASICGAATSATPSKRLPRNVLARLRAQDHGGRFTTQGRFAAATVRGTTWTTEDTCAGTLLTVQSGTLLTASTRSLLSTTLSPGQTVEYQCGSSYCTSLFGGQENVANAAGAQVQTPFYRASVDAKVSADEYQLCVLGGGSNGCTDYPLSSPDHAGYSESVVSCVPGTAAAYQVTWEVNDSLLGPSLVYTAPSGPPSGVSAGCTSVPVARTGFPSGLNQTVSTAHFIVHYDGNTNPNDPNAIPTAEANNIAQIAEAALTYETQTLGMPMYAAPEPYLGNASKIDIYATASTQYLSVTYPWPEAPGTDLPSLGNPTSAYIVQSTFDTAAIGRAVFAVLLDAVGHLTTDVIDDNNADAGLWGNAIVWAGANFAESENQLTSDQLAYAKAPPLSESLDCDVACSDQTLDLGYELQWRFFEHLTEKFGPTIVEQILAEETALARQSGTWQMDTALQDVLAAHGSSLASELAAYAFEDDIDSWAESWMVSLPFAFTISSATILPLATTGGSFTASPVVVKHLASHVLRLTVAAASAPCVTDTLTINPVPVPSGGIFAGSALSSGGTVNHLPNPNPALPITITFSSCNGATVDLTFTNGTSTDGMTFQVSGQLS